MKRYIVELDFFLFAETPEKAIEQAKKIAFEMELMENTAIVEVQKISEAHFATDIKNIIYQKQKS